MLVCLTKSSCLCYASKEAKDQASVDNNSIKKKKNSTQIPILDRENKLHTPHPNISNNNETALLHELNNGKCTTYPTAELGLQSAWQLQIACIRNGPQKKKASTTLSLSPLTFLQPRESSKSRQKYTLYGKSMYSDPFSYLLLVFLLLSPLLPTPPPW